MTSINIIEIFFFLLILSVCKAELYCYICTTASGLHADKCGDDFRLTSVDAVSCQDGSCQKTRGYRTEGSKKVVEVTRGCVSYTQSDTCYEGTNYGVSATICTCNTVYCNGASTLIPSTKFSLSTGVLLTLLIYNVL
ncbi:uncharacterized protein LOC123556341 [Mercenaria mercenaria]|uniref:uncharacterized protein LOC123556341 n=1 Tax=Mercenaria mercenaria TaxID=6596 RepID=UPI00234F9CBC|nr:uncharacterized protein LOC123556341 [Mercenaria mercenaria]